MSKFENATPRPWIKDDIGRLKGANGERVTVYDLGVAMAMNSPDEEERANAELIVRAVNAYDELCEAVQHALNMVETDQGPPDWDWLRAVRDRARGDQ